MSPVRHLLPLALLAACAAFVAPKVLGALGLAGSLDQGPVDLSDIAGPAGSGPGLGVNLTYQAYWSSQQPFVDLFSLSSEWLPQEVRGYTWDTGQPLDLDELGWVRRLAEGQAAGKVMARELEGRYPGGTYHLTWEGNGRFEAHADAKAPRSTEDGLLVWVEPSNAGVHLKLVETDPADPVRNVRFVREGLEEQVDEAPFEREFLSYVEPFGVLRFMDWQHTNDSQQRTFDQRTTPDHATQAGPAGVALEHCIELGNVLEQDIWLCVPHLADDAYVRAMAELVAAELEPGLRVWIEYSNEVWNDQFDQAHYADQQGLALELSENRFQARLRYYARRACEVFAIWEDAFGDQAESRLVRVLAGQCANPWTGTTILEFEQAAKRADAYAVAPYFGVPLGSPERRAETAALDSEGLFAALDADLTEVLKTVRENVRVAAEHGLPLVAYEAGQHLVGYGGVQDDEALAARFMEANRDPRMGALYDRLLEGWMQLGGRTICLWNSIETYSKWGSWGLVEYADTERSDAPKLDAALRFSEEHGRWW